MKIGFVGLGIMGSRMASHLIKNEVDLMVYNRTREATKELGKAGVEIAESANELAGQVDVLFSMLSKPDAVREVFFGEDGALSVMKKDAVWVDCSTVNPSFSREAKQKADQHGVNFIDAPVAGSKPQAEAAELVFFAGGENVLIDRAEPYMNMMGKKVVRFSETGHGASFKMLVNMLLGQSMLIFSEAVHFGQKMGLEQEFLLKVLPTLPVSAPFTQFKAAAMSSDDYAVQFPLEWMRKDLKLASATAKELGHSLNMNHTAEALYDKAMGTEFNRLDFSVIHKFLVESA